ncbi:cytochrome P450 [Xylaria sp. FL0043]|nr:cytochrome P450 [Xylaria sp. FL0043]
MTGSSVGCHFAVRSGGHASFVGASNIKDGVTVDLSKLSDITISQPGGSVAPVLSVGAGCRWGAVYAYLDKMHLSVSGGRAASVGVGGLTLGGGISYFGPRFGWACDTVVNFEVILANGTLVNANSNENPDLLWALRGGTNNFGVVTRIDLRTFPQGDLWGGQAVRPIETAEQQILALAAFTNPINYDEFASLITTFGYSGIQDQQAVVNDMQYTVPLTNPSVFRNLTNMTAYTNTQRVTNMSDLATETEANDPNGFRQASATLTIVSDVAAINATVRAWSASINSIRTIPGISWSVGMDPLPPQLYARHAGANALGLAGREGRAMIIINLTAMWSRAADDNTVHKATKALIAAIKRDVGVLGALDPFLYVNYAAPWQAPIGSYGEASVERLRRVQRIYDPQRVFTRLVPGGACLNARRALALQIPVVRTPVSPESNVWVIVQPLVWRVLDRCVAIPWSSYPNFIRFSHHFGYSRRLLQDWITGHEARVTNLEENLRALTFNVLAAAAFQESRSPEKPSLQLKGRETGTEAYRDTLHVVLENAILLMLLPYRYLNRSLIPKSLSKIGRAAESFKSILMEMVREEAAAIDRDIATSGGLLTPLVRAFGTHTFLEQEDANERMMSRAKRGMLSADEILGNIFAINFAGHDTVLIALTFTLTLLAVNIDIQDWLSEEITAIFRNDVNPEGRSWDYNEFPQLIRCQAVFLETLRLFAPITGVPKMATERATNLQVGDHLISVPTGIEVFPVLLGIQTDTRYWGEDSCEWRPMRWIVQSEAIGKETLLVPRKGTFFPWSDGPQNCVGKKFSIVEGVAVLARLFHQHRLRLLEFDNETHTEACKRAQDCAHDVNYNLLLRMNHPERVKLRVEVK